MSLGMYHAGLSKQAAIKYSSVRLTLGLDPAQVDILAQALTELDDLNN
jgi:hypothetical protein